MMINYAAKMFVHSLMLILPVVSLIVGGNARAVDFDPFGPNETETRLPETVTDEGPTIPEIQLNNNDISMAFQIVSDATGWSIFPTEQASRAKVNLWAKDITAKKLLDTVVQLAGFLYRRQGDIISVMTYDEYMQYYGLAKKVIPLAYAEAESVSKVIKPFMSKLGKTVVHQQTNTIVLYEADANLEFITGVIEKLDTPAEDIVAEVIELQYTNCKSVADILQQAFAIGKKTPKNKTSGAVKTDSVALSTDSDRGEPNSAGVALIPYEQVGIFAVLGSNQLVVVGAKSDVEKVKSIVVMIDVSGTNMVLEVIVLKYADAEMVAQTLQKVFPVKDSKDSAKDAHRAIRPSSDSEQRISSSGIETKGILSAPEAQVQIYAIGRTNQLIVKAFRGDLEMVKKLVAKLDVFVEPTTKSYHFTYVDASQIYKGLERILDIYSRSSRSYPGGSQTGSRGYQRGSGLTLVERTNSILLTGPPSSHRIMSSIKESVDAPGRYEAGMIRVYKIENADVEQIADTIRELIATPQEQQGKPGEPKFGETTEKAPEPGATEMATTEKFVPQIEPKVSVNKATNSIVVLSTVRQHRELEKLIKELDVRRKQVLIKAVIVEVTTNDDMDLGVELDYIGRDAFAFTSFGLTSFNPATGDRDIIVSPGGTAAVLRPNRVRAIFKALQSSGNARIKSSPQILVNDNAIGTIQSIAEEPTTQTNQGETTTTTSFAGFVEAGTQFAITPHISEGDYLRVQYQITLNSFGSKPTDPSIPPPRNTSSIQSEATVPDGSTIVVGGIQSTNESESVDKVPLLGDFPLIGPAFRNTIIRRQYTTTYLFITTTIMKRKDFGDLKDISDKALGEVMINESDETPDADDQNS